jgi:hypothetical protein
MPTHDYKPGHARNATVSTVTAAIIALALAACASTATTDSVTVTPAAASPGASAVTITGSGSTFDAPFFDLAFARYRPWWLILWGIWGRAAWHSRFRSCVLHDPAAASLLLVAFPSCGPQAGACDVCRSAAMAAARAAAR